MPKQCLRFCRSHKIPPGVVLLQTMFGIEQMLKCTVSTLSMLLLHFDVQYQMGGPLEYGIKL